MREIGEVLYDWMQKMGFDHPLATLVIAFLIVLGSITVLSHYRREQPLLWTIPLWLLLILVIVYSFIILASRVIIEMEGIALIINWIQTGIVWISGWIYYAILKRYLRKQEKTTIQGKVKSRNEDQSS